MQIIICSASSSLRHPVQLSLSCEGLNEGKTRENGVEHGQDAWKALREKYDGCSREALRAAHREFQTVKIRSDEDPDDFLYIKDRCRDRLNSVTPTEGPSDRRHEDINLAVPSTRVRQNLPDAL